MLTVAFHYGLSGASRSRDDDATTVQKQDSRPAESYSSPMFLER